MYRGNAVAAGVFFVVAAVAAIAGLALYQPALTDPDYLLGAGADTRVLLGGWLEVLLAASCIGTGVALYPVVRRESESVALGYVCGRVLEAAIIATGIAATLSLVSLRGTGTGPDVARALVALHDWTFLLGPGLVIGVNSLLLALLVYRSRLVPRWIAVLGLVGGPLVFASSTAVLFGLVEDTSPWRFVAAVPVTAWEMSLAVRLIVRGFSTTPAGVRARPAAGAMA